MKRYEIIPKQFWENKVTGATASVYGATPWISDADRDNWERVVRGASLRDNRLNTVSSQAGDTSETITERMNKFRQGWENMTC